MSEWKFIIAAYSVTWVVLISYAVRLSRVNRQAAALLNESARAGTGESL